MPRVAFFMLIYPIFRISFEAYSCNLFSVRAVTQKGLVVQFGHSCCWIKNSSGEVVGKGRLINRMYQLICETEMPQNEASLADQVHQAHKDKGSSQMSLWNQRLGCLNEMQLIQALECLVCGGVVLSTPRMHC